MIDKIKCDKRRCDERRLMICVFLDEIDDMKCYEMR